MPLAERCQKADVLSAAICRANGGSYEKEIFEGIQRVLCVVCGGNHDRAAD